MTDLPAAGAPASAVLAENPAPEVKAGDWSNTVIIANGRGPADTGRRRVIVTEHRGAPKFNAKGDVTAPGELKITGYPKDADIFYRTDASVQFPEDGAVFTLGDNLVNKGVGGFSARGVRVGPGDPAYAGVNLAIQRGAKKIEVFGLTKEEQARLQPWFDSPKMPEGVEVTFA